MQIKDSGKLKSSDQRKIRQAINDQYPLLVSLSRRCLRCAPAPPPGRPRLRALGACACTCTRHRSG